MPACRCCCWTSCPRGADRPQRRSPSGAVAKMLQDRARAVHVARARPSWSRPATSRTISAAGRVRLDHRGDRRAARTSSRRCTRKLDAVRQPGTAMSLQHLDHPARAADRGDAGERSRAISSSPISSIRRATCACWRSCRARTPTRRWSRAVERLRRPRARQDRGRAARTRRASSPTASAPTGCRSRIDEAIDLGLTVEEADAVDGHADRHAEDRRVRPARPGRPRPDAACQRQPARGTLPPDDAVPRDATATCR